MEVEAMNVVMEFYESKDEAKFLALCQEKGLEVKIIGDKDHVKTFRVANVVDAIFHNKPGKAKSVSLVVVPN
jgi:hypothetical protein